jgi:20S proteasome alpha/beta subunit
MTLLIGMRARDGIVLGADRKIMRGGEPQFSDKIKTLQDVTYATEGLTGVADDFLHLFEQAALSKKGFSALYEARLLAEDIISELHKRYSERLKENQTVGLVMAGLENLSSGPARLYYIYPEGYGEAVTFTCTGSGGPYATTLAKFLHDEGASVEENAKRVAFVISWVSEKVDAYVGGIPQIAMIRDDNQTVSWLEQSEIDRQVTNVDQARKELWKRLLQ